jgi:hypothetical protein
MRLGTFRLNRLQRLLLFGSVAVWFLYAVLSQQRNYQDSWILEGVFWPFVGFIAVLLIVLEMEMDNRWVALLCTGTVLVILLVPGLKYKQPYSETVDAVIHLQLVNSLMATGRTVANTYQATAGMHSWLASLGLTSGLSATDVIKLGFPLLGAILPLLMYWLCRRNQMPPELTRQVICLSCLATFPYFLITGTGFTMIPAVFFLGVLFAREFLSTSVSEKMVYTLLALIALVQLTLWHSTTPLLLVLILLGAAFTPVLVWLVTGRKTKTEINTHFLRLGLLAAVLVLGYHSIQLDPIFRIEISNLYQLLESERDLTAAVPASFFQIPLIEKIQVFLVMFGRDAVLVILSILGFWVIWSQRARLGRSLYFYVYLSVVFAIFLLAFPVSLIGIDFRRLMWLPLTLSPFFAGFFLWWWRGKLVRKGLLPPRLLRVLGILLIVSIIGISILEFYVYQPLVPKSRSLTPETPDEYVVWLHQVNTAYQQRMISFAETFSGPEMRFDIDILGNRQFVRYYGGIMNRDLFLPLHPMYGWNDPDANTTERLFLLHWPGKAGGYGEKLQYRTVEFLSNLRDSMDWDLIYDNGESFVLKRR